MIEKCEDEHHPIETSDLDPIDTLKFLVEQNNITMPQLGEILGQRQLGSKIINKNHRVKAGTGLTLVIQRSWLINTSTSVLSCAGTEISPGKSVSLQLNASGRSPGTHTAPPARG